MRGSSARNAVCLAIAAMAILVVGPAKETAAAASRFEEIAPGVYARHGLVAEETPENQGAIANIGFVVGDEAVAMIDSGGSVADGEDALEAIRRVTDKPVAYLIDTHMHPDHLFGNQVFKSAGATIVGHRRLPAALAARAEFYKQSMAAQIGPELAGAVSVTPPDETVEDERRIDLGGRTLVVKAWGTAHTDNDLTVFDEETGTLFAGDLVFMDHCPVLDGSLKGWLAQIPDLMAIPAKRVVPGHGPVSAPWPAAIEPERRYLETLAADIRKAIAAGIPLADAVADAAAGESGKWQLFEDYNPRNATAAYAELEWE
ncbi:quinoprotein relay system zinc metallohydrolase 2 [Jiella avicenniae]|uniref:Quinoprotein relay system zinc metallohydrolase 2 n=1 Tax=Jiella avicenniae TaxID=2907202 RepID=A0A9X1P3G8_9HYPH|nr:quinoprotein relay system zinc metallohydrolase 2 [Jiella avicenniae]MCE7028623.1 quinoprotein relay system zinc metallohydrolase 2 [Jiella avicenniae]